MKNTSPTTRTTQKSYISPYENDIKNVSTKKAVLYLHSKGEKIWQIAATLNKERSVIYYHLKGAQKKERDSLELSYKRALKKNPKHAKLTFERYVELLKIKGKFICHFSGKEIDIATDKWAINSQSSYPYIYFKRYTYLDLMGEEFEQVCIHYLRKRGHEVTVKEFIF